MTSTSQWSLALAARKRGTTSKLLVWTPGRNGAWPWRPGKVGAAGIVFLAGEGRNGAWPWRPGKVEVPVEVGLGVDVAMEPGRGGQEKRHRRDPHEGRHSVAMEPGRGGQEKRLLEPVAGQALLVAMEPGRGGQEKLGGHTLPNRIPSQSQWSLAVAARKSLADLRDLLRVGLSQWSLAVAARKRGRPERAPRRCCGRNGAWPWRPGKATWLGTGRIGRCRRNGAWPWRPGKGGFRRPWRSVSESRNGAWPWRPGKAVTEGGWEIEFLVAMEPGRGGQEKKRPARTRQEPPMSQWSLAVAARKSRITK